VVAVRRVEPPACPGRRAAPCRAGAATGACARLETFDVLVQIGHALGECPDLLGGRHADLVHGALDAALEQRFEVVPGFLGLLARVADTRLQRGLRAPERIAHHALRRRARGVQHAQPPRTPRP
jgi:hypothetical protein